MIGRLRGVIESQAVDGSCVIDVAGVGYEVFVPLATSAHLPSPPESATLYVHTHVREDALVLYGFATPNDREAFRLLLGVSSVGPRIAMAILGAMSASELAHAIARSDRTRFKGISGVGNKTIDRLLLELRDKMHSLHTGPLPKSKAATGGKAEPLSQVAEALIHMGYKRSEASQAIATIASESEQQPVEELLRRALAALA